MALSALALHDVFLQGIASSLAPGALDPAFSAPDVGAISHFAVQPDGRIVVLAGRRVLRMNSDGSIDPSLAAKASGASIQERGGGAVWTVDVTSLHAVALQPDQKILVAGAFTQLGGAARQNIARFNVDGSLDETFQAHITDGFLLDLSQFSGDNVRVESMAALADGRILMGGGFYKVDGQVRNQIAILQHNGALDSAFDPGTGFSPRLYAGVGNLSEVGATFDGKLFAAGRFSTYNDVARSSIVLLARDGSLDLNFAPQLEGESPTVAALLLQSDGRIVIGGSFVDQQTRSRTNLVRLEANGRLDASFNADLEGSSVITALALQPDGKLIVSGNFRSIQGFPRLGLARLHSNGALDLSFDAGGLDVPATQLTVLSNETVLVSGSFTHVAGASRSSLVRLAVSSRDAPEEPRFMQEPSGSLIATAGQTIALAGFAAGFPPPLYQWSLNGRALPGATNRVLSFRNISAKNAGYYRVTAANASGMSTSTVASITVNSTAYSAGSPELEFSPQFPPNTAHPTLLRSVKVLSDGRYVAAYDGWFTHAQGQALQFQKDGTLNLPIQFNLGLAHTVWLEIIAIRDDGKFILTGSTADADSMAHLFRANTDGTLDITYDTGRLRLGSTPNLYEAQSDGSLVLISRDGTIDRFKADGSKDPTFQSGVLLPAATDLTQVQMYPEHNGQLLLVGPFTTVQGMARAGLARLDTNGSVDPGFNPTFANSYGPGPAVYNLATYADGKMLVAGTFYRVDDQSRAGVARLNHDGTVDPSFDAGNLFDQWSKGVYAWNVQPDGRIVVAAAFGRSSASVLRLNSDGTRDPSFQTKVQISDDGWGAAAVRFIAFQHIGILSLEFHVDKLSRPLL